MRDYKHIFRQIARGCTDLPYVGDHPGKFNIIMLVFMAGLLGSNHGVEGAVIAMVGVIVFLSPLVLWGAYQRAELSDSIVKKHGKNYE